MSKPSVYSPLPATSYVLDGVNDCEVSWILRQPLAVPIWNLFWLSNPNIDVIPGSGNSWWSKYRAVEGTLSAVTADVLEDEVLYRKLLMSTQRFVDWFERADHQSYQCYHVMGGDQWVQNVICRARGRGQIVALVDNVTHVNFTRRTA